MAKSDTQEQTQSINDSTDYLFETAMIDSVHLMLAAKERSGIIYPGDHLQISIYDKLPVSQEKRIEMKRVNGDGSILIVPIGQITIAGLSIIQAQELIEDSLSKYVKSPFCEIDIVQREYEPIVYVFGEVNKNGSIPLKRGDRILDVLSTIGGVKNEAYRRSIKIIRKLANDKIGMYSVNLYAILAEGNTKENILLQDRDIIYVPRHFLTNLEEVLSTMGSLMPWYLFFGSMVK